MEPRVFGRSNIWPPKRLRTAAWRLTVRQPACPCPLAAVATGNCGPRRSRPCGRRGRHRRHVARSPTFRAGQGKGQVNTGREDSDSKANGTLLQSPKEWGGGGVGER